MPDPTPSPRRDRAAGGTRTLTAPGADPPTSPGATPDTPAGPPIPLTVEVVLGNIVREPAPVAVVGRMERSPVTGVLREFNGALNDWLAHAVELGMIGSEVGELFYVPVPKGTAVAAGAVLLAGMGEPGRFTEDDLRYLYANVTFALTALRYPGFATVLIGANTGVPPVRVARDLVVGVATALKRLTDPPARGITVAVVVRTEARQEEVRQSLEQFRDEIGEAPPDRDSPLARVKLGVTARVQKGWTPTPAAVPRTGRDLDPQLPSTRVTVVAAPAGRGRRDRLLLQYAALKEGASIPVRELAVHHHIVAGLPGRLAVAPDEGQVRYGRLLTEYLIPEEFRKLLTERDAVTLTVDAQTARFPWEMAVVAVRSGPTPLGVHVPVARQFRSERTGVFGVPPPLNRQLRVLVVADPSSADAPLPGAREEGLEVVRVMNQVKTYWGDQLDLRVVLRLGSPDDPTPVPLEAALTEARGYGCVTSAERCEPIELLAVLANDEFDVVHFAGHGSADAARGRVGWVFAKDHVWSAEEVFGVRRVPRLVFANACHSDDVGATAGSEQEQVQRARVRNRQVREQVGMAEAFFTRGVRNYVGTGWAVNDVQARAVAREFYRRVLGVPPRDDPGRAPAAPPMVIGRALAEARVAIRKSGGTTWGAYHHYGQWNDKLLPVLNRDGTAAGEGDDR